MTPTLTPSPWARIRSIALKRIVVARDLRLPVRFVSRFPSPASSTAS
jgi:hypothetical protein